MTPFQTRGALVLPRRRIGLSYLLGFLFLASVHACFGTGERVLGTDRDLEGLSPFSAKSLTSWQWTPEEKKRTDEFSRMSLTRDAAGNMLWTLKVSPDIPFKRPYLETLDLGTKFFPPDADAIRMKVRAVSGSILIGPGGPTAYFGNSDVFLRPAVIDAAKDGPEWRTVEFSLHEGLMRNFRRAGFSGDAPWIYYARWAQEPTRFYVFKGSVGEIQIKDLEIISKGVAQPFPAFSGDDVITVASLADFRRDEPARAFTALIGGNGEEFEASWKSPEKVARRPAEIRIENDQEEGKVLHSRGLFLEEMSAVGVMIPNSRDGEGLRFRIKADSEAVNVMLPAVPCQPLDFLLYVSTAGTGFNWKQFAQTTANPDSPVKGYDYNLTQKKVSAVNGLSLAIYHARRFVPRGQWSDVVIPFADFLCIQGSGDLVDRFHSQLAADPNKLIAAAFLAPWPRKGRFATSIDIRSIELVRFRNVGETRRSYYQFPDTSGLHFQKSPNGGCSIQLAPGETDLPADLKTLLRTWD